MFQQKGKAAQKKSLGKVSTRNIRLSKNSQFFPIETKVYQSDPTIVISLHNNMGQISRLFN